ncbi:MAG: hypothetical protein ACUZ8E_12275 [Candidatus Anammoxibacter sp.]
MVKGKARRNSNVNNLMDCKGEYVATASFMSRKILAHGESLREVYNSGKAVLKGDTPVVSFIEDKEAFYCHANS